ncbi:DNA polymerase III subunit delta [Sphingomonas sabuli]
MLADEAAAIGMFGDKRALWVEPAGDEIVAAVEALLELSVAESPAIAIAGALRKSSALVKLAEAHAACLSHVSYELGEREATSLVQELARGEGLRLAEGVAGRLAGAAGNERGVIAQELAKIALYVDASADSPALVDAQVLDDIGAGSEGDSTRLGDLALSGDVDALTRELDASAGDAVPISVLRSLQRRIMMLAPIRAKVDRGQRPHDAVTSSGNAVFFKDKDLVARLVSLWDSVALERVLQRSGELERRLMRSDSPPEIEALEEELVAIARTARRR